MTITIEMIKQDLITLVNNCNDQADESKGIDPLLDIAFSQRIDSESDIELKISLLIDRNSGGSPESDYAIQDEINLHFSSVGKLSVIFNREMVEEEAIDQILTEPTQWNEVLEKIDLFCHQNLPRPLMGDGL